MKNKKSILITAILFVAIFGLHRCSNQHPDYLSFTEKVAVNKEKPAFDRNISEEKNAIQIKYNFDGAKVSDVEINGKTYSKLYIKGLSHLSQPGNPAVPVRRETLTVPSGGELKLTAEKGDYKEMKKYRLVPAKKPARDTEGASEPGYEFNEKRYQTDAFFPEEIVKIIDVQKRSDEQIVIIEVRPVQHNPVKQAIRVYSDISFILKW